MILCNIFRSKFLGAGVRYVTDWYCTTLVLYFTNRMSVGIQE